MSEKIKAKFVGGPLDGTTKEIDGISICLMLNEHFYETTGDEDGDALVYKYVDFDAPFPFKGENNG